MNDIALLAKEAEKVAVMYSAPEFAPAGALLRGIAEDTDLLQLVRDIPEDRFPSVLILVAGLYLVFKLRPDPLTRYFPSLSDDTSPPGDPWPQFREFCLEHRQALLDLIRTRRHQKNEVTRYSVIVPALGVVHDSWPDRSIGLLDLGTSSGLALHLDRYHYDYGGGKTVGDPASRVRIQCEVRGRYSPPVPPRIPIVNTRLGVDLDPVDIHDPDALLWLRACLMETSVASTARLRHAIDIAQSEPARIERGNAVQRLAELCAEIPDSDLLCVLDSFTLQYATPQELATFHQTLDRIGSHRELAWISFDVLDIRTDTHNSLQGFHVPDELFARHEHTTGISVLGIIRYQSGLKRSTLLSLAHNTGEWIEWVDQGSASGPGPDAR